VFKFSNPASSPTSSGSKVEESSDLSNLAGNAVYLVNRLPLETCYVGG
jgi:hypothetical protein